MASSNPTNGTDRIFMFGVYHQALAAEPNGVLNMVEGQGLLRPEEASFIRGIAASDDSTAVAAYQDTLNLGLDYFYTIKHQIASLQDAWDRILDEKRRYDALGWPNSSRSFVDCFRVCSYLIPQRVSIGFPGPYLDAPVLIASLEPLPLSVKSRSAPDHTETSTVFGGSEATVTDPVGETSTQDGGLEPFLLQYPEELALSPTTSEDTFQQVDDRDSTTELLSISSDDSGSSSGDDSEGSGGLQFPLELEDVVFIAGRGDTFRTGLPRAQQPHQEEASPQESLPKRRLSSVSESRALQPRGKPLSPRLGSGTSKKRKHSMSNGYEDEKGTPWRISGNRPWDL